MKDHRKLSIGLVLALATLALVGSMASVGLINTARWASSLPPEVDLSVLPAGAALSIVKLALQFLACLGGFLCIVFGNCRVARLAAISALALLLLLHLASWALAPAAFGGTFLAQYGLRIGFAVWLVGVFVALVPNKSFKPTPLRGSA